MRCDIKPPMVGTRKTFSCTGFRGFVVSTASLGFLISLITTTPAAQAKLNLGVSSTNYLGIGEAGRPDSYSALDLGLDSKTDGDEVDSRLLVQSEIGFNDSSYRFIELPDAYLSTAKKLGPVNFAIGRKLQSWGALDDTWGTGIFQPQFRWDYLRPQQVGLLGFYQDYEQGPVHTTLFYSPIFIPDRGAPLDFSDGRIRSISPWVVNPPYEVEIQRQQVPVHYDARIPKLGEIVRQNTFAGRVEVGEKRGFWGATAYAYKPMNQLLMSYEGDLTAPAAGGGTANVILYPRVAYHHVATADVGYHGTQMGGFLSFMADIPKDDPQTLSRVSQQVGNFYSLSPTVVLNPFGQHANGGNMTLSYLKVFGEDLPDTGPSIFVDGKTSEFDSRYPFKNAFLFSAALPTWRRLSTDVKLLVDLENPGTIVSWYFQYEPQKEWHLFLSTDVLSSFSDQGDGTNFISRYRENDRVTGGVSYAF